MRRAGARSAMSLPVMRLALPLACMLVLGASNLGCAGDPDDPPPGAPADADACDEAAPPTRTASCVNDLSAGEGAGYGMDRFPEVVFGEPLGGGASGGSLDVLSLGKGGEIVLGFGGNAIVDGEGVDFIVFENAFYVQGDPDKVFKELGEVSVSADGAEWVTFSCRTDAYPHEGCAGWRATFANPEAGVSAFDPEVAGGDPFDLAEVGLAEARFVRIRDVSNFGAADTAGFDLDAVAIVNAAR